MPCDYWLSRPFRAFQSLEKQRRNFPSIGMIFSTPLVRHHVSPWLYAKAEALAEADGAFCVVCEKVRCSAWDSEPCHLLLIDFAVGAGGGVQVFLELAGHVGVVLEPAFAGDLGDGHLGMLEQLAGL